MHNNCTASFSLSLYPKQSEKKFGWERGRVAKEKAAAASASVASAAPGATLGDGFVYSDEYAHNEGCAEFFRPTLAVSNGSEAAE